MMKNTGGAGDFRHRLRAWARRAGYLARPVPLLVLTAVLIVGCAATPVSKKPGVSKKTGETACAQPGHWIEPASGKRMAPETVLKALSRRRVVLLGETHDYQEDHLWQAQMLAALHAYRPNTVIAFEMFPRSVQAVLDEWVKGALSEKAFLEATRWKEVWGYGANFYMPMFQFARQNRLPMVAANVDRSLIRQVSRESWNSIPANERRGIGTPAPASEAYRRSLARVYGEKMKRRPHHGRPVAKKPPAAKAEQGEAVSGIDAILENPGFQNFVDAQLTWDRAMAEAIAAALQKNP
ncbi:MAG: ChaN family lipoprotein, partial [Rhodospirillales bacterium]|nr:ChaN family lipoprotein [Rhodospirillales bacterium]